jgi:hypothetical protein
MPDIASLVPPGEDIVFVTRPSLWSRAVTIAGAALTCAAGLLAMSGPDAVEAVVPGAGSALRHVQGYGGRGGATAWLVANPGLVVFLVGVAAWARAALSCTRTTFLVTERRVLASYGILTRDLEEITANRIRGVELHRGVLGSLLGYGDVVVAGFGGEIVALGRASRPMALLRAIEGIQT